MTGLIRGFDDIANNRVLKPEYCFLAISNKIVLNGRTHYTIWQKGVEVGITGEEVAEGDTIIINIDIGKTQNSNFVFTPDPFLYRQLMELLK